MITDLLSTKEKKETKNEVYSFDDRLSELEKLTTRINARKKAQSSSQDILVSMLESCPLPMWVKTLDGTMTFFNEAYANVYGIKPEEYMGKKDTDFWPEDVASTFLVNDLETLKDGIQYKVEIIPSHKENGKSLDRDHITVVKWKVNLDGKVLGVAGIVTSVFPK